MGRPRTLTDEQRRANKLSYMRSYYEAHRPLPRIFADDEPSPNRADAYYDPERDGPPRYSSVTAFICGDPPIGRAALDRSKV
jgi:hypothetical protein